MSLKQYLNEIKPGPVASEIGFYTPLATHIFGALLGYPPRHRIINKSGEHGIPDIRLYSQEDDSEWAVVEAKLDDEEIRNEGKRQKIWRDQILEHGYIGPETFYIVLCAPRTFYVCDLDGALLECVHIEDGLLIDPRNGMQFPLTDTALRERLHTISYAASLERKQFEAFREGKLKSGHVRLTPQTLPQLQSVFEDAVIRLREFCRFRFHELRNEYLEALGEIRKIEQRLEDIGSGPVKLREKLKYRILTIRAQRHLAFKVFEGDYDRFKHDQTYAGTQKEEHFEDIFCTNTAHVALSRLFFVRICEDSGLTTRKISNSGITVWREFVQNIKENYNDLLEVAFKDIRHIYLSLFEPSVFDWFGKFDGKLDDILERILFRLNAFSFSAIDRDLLGVIYQSFRPRIERRRLGEYYTPEEVVDFILAQTGIASDSGMMQKRILDPSCGSFTFGVRAIPLLLRTGAHLSPDNQIDLVRSCLRGQDINPFSTFLSHLSILFSLLDLYLEAKRRNPQFEMRPFNIRNRNSLTYGVPSPGEEDAGTPPDLVEEIEPVDYIVGNPPFVRNERIPQEDRPTLESLYASLQAGNTDLAAYFLYDAFEYWLKPEGTLGMVAPLSIASAGMARELRRYLNAREMTAIVSLEWLRLRKEIFQGIDIVPMLIFARNAKAATPHKIRVIHGLEHRGDLKRFIADPVYASEHTASIDFSKWYSLSPTGDWPVEVTAEDVPILEKLNRADKLSSAAKAAYGIKLGSGAQATSPYQEAEINKSRIPLIKGQNICSFYTDGITLELFHLDRLDTVSDPSIWAGLDFYRRNRGKFDDEGTGRKDLKHDGLAGLSAASDIRCCAIAGVYRTLLAGWFSPAEFAAHNSALVLLPTKFSAPVTAASVNSRFSRYYAFLLLRSAVVQRAHCTFYPRTLDSLPLPKLTARQVKKLHKLAMEAFDRSAQGAMGVRDLYLEKTETAKLIKAGFLGMKVANQDATIDREDLAAAEIRTNELIVGEQKLTAESPGVLMLARVALLAKDQDEFTSQDIENILLPADSTLRANLTGLIRNFVEDLQKTQDRVLAIMEEIDEIVAEGLGLTASEHETIRRRCQEFPLSATIERPRFAWSPDRKRQARRTYQPGDRFK